MIDIFRIQSVRMRKLMPKVILDTLVVVTGWMKPLNNGLDNIKTK